MNNSLNGLQKKKKTKKISLSQLFYKQNKRKLPTRRSKKQLFFGNENSLIPICRAQKKRMLSSFFFVTKFTSLRLRKKILVWTRFQQKVFFFASATHVPFKKAETTQSKKHKMSHLSEKSKTMQHQLRRKQKPFFSWSSGKEKNQQMLLLFFFTPNLFFLSCLFRFCLWSYPSAVLVLELINKKKLVSHFSCFGSCGKKLSASSI